MQTRYSQDKTIFTATLAREETVRTMMVAKLVRTEWKVGRSDQAPIEGMKKLWFETADQVPFAWLGETIKLTEPDGTVWWVTFDGKVFHRTATPQAA